MGKQRSEIRVAAFFVIYAALLSLLVFRTVSVASAFAIPLVALLIVSLFHRYRRSRLPVRRVGLVAAMLALLVPGAVASQIFGLIIPKAETKQARAKLQRMPVGCFGFCIGAPTQGAHPRPL